MLDWQFWRRKEQPGGFEIRARRRLGWQFWALIAGAVVFAMLAIASLWYIWAIQPKDDPSTQQYQLIVIDEGDTASVIGQKLEEAGIIRSALAMRIYTELTGTRDKLQVGGYRISSSESVEHIVEHLVSGQTDQYNLTILAGQTLEELEDKLIGAGYSRESVKRALGADYDHPLLSDRPVGSTLEGYIFPETYRVDASSGLDKVFERSFDELYDKLEQNGMLAAFKKQGLSLHEAITLASIVQEEVSDPEDQKKVAQVFLARLKSDMPLGSDPTFKYAAKQMGVEPRIDLESPYNTRVNKGLPPGPIANMEFSALEAVASPAKTKYLYFVSGDDGRTHFSHTLEEHEAATARYCTTLCE